ncbi:hypothetical protein [Saccharothrix australiensis]|uniref:hypothetical protein n=1 Tax=Saccharothrix australiensis TaxID=2072 RepID=UPI00319DCFBE
MNEGMAKPLKVRDAGQVAEHPKELRWNVHRKRSEWVEVDLVEVEPPGVDRFEHQY